MFSTSRIPLLSSSRYHWSSPCLLISPLDRDWETNGFKKKLYIVLSSEAEDIADKVAECISKLDEAHHGLIDYPLFCDLQYSFINIINHVQRTSKSLSVYHLENLW